MVNVYEKTRNKEGYFSRTEHLNIGKEEDELRKGNEKEKI